MTIVIYSEAEETTVVQTTDAPTLNVSVAQVYAQNFSMPKRSITSDDTAVAGDEFKLLEIDAGVAPVTLTIDPADFTGLTLHIRCKDGTQVATVAQSSGNMELKNGSDQTSVQLLTRETIDLYSDGTKLIEV